MLIKSLRLKNFRQFKKIDIEFSIDTKKNITMIKGDNGNGKTTLQQAFLWILYGRTDFKKQDVLNLQVKDAMDSKAVSQVLGEIEIIQNDKVYIIRRTQNYIKATTKVSADNSILKVMVKNDTGILQTVDGGAAYAKVKEIMPRELSRFFFFDGERMEKMSDELDKGRGDEFKLAVEGLVGLTAVQSAIKHIEPVPSSRANTTVLGRFSSKINESSNEKVQEYNKKIAEYEEQIEKKQMRKEELEPQIVILTNECVELNRNILSFSNDVEKKERYEKLLKEIEHLGVQKNEAVNNMLRVVRSKNSFSFFSSPVISVAIPLLKHADVLDKGIPKLHQDTIDYLLNRHECICGAHLNVGTPQYDIIYKLRDFVPPKSIGMLIDDFNKEAKRNQDCCQDYLRSFQTSMAHLTTIQQTIDGKNDEATTLYSQLTDTSQVSKLKEQLSEKDGYLKRYTHELAQIQPDIDALCKQLDRQKTERDNLLLIDSTNAEYLTYKLYAETLYNRLSETYHRHEVEVRKDLEVTINRIFQEIYDGSISLSLDEKYNITITTTEQVENYDDVEYSTAQNYSVIFAFISGIIELAKKKANEKDEDIFNEAEKFPLVMDAPLSAFDKTRIKNICDTIPKIAEQVIFFIKDTDGDIAQKQLGAKISKKYTISRVDNSRFHSIVEEGE